MTRRAARCGPVWSTSQLARGERLFDEGDAGDRLYVVLDGKIKLTRTAADGRENLLQRARARRDVRRAVPVRPAAAHARARSRSPTARLAALDHDDLRHWLTGRPDVALHLLQALAQRLRRANDVMADLVFTDVPGRVAKALLDLADRFGEQQEEGLQVHHDLTQEELAQLVGASRETVNKALADFAARGWLQLSAKSVLILDRERLAKRPLRSGWPTALAGSPRDRIRPYARAPRI